MSSVRVIINVNFNLIITKLSNTITFDVIKSLNIISTSVSSKRESILSYSQKNVVHIHIVVGKVD